MAVFYPPVEEVQGSLDTYSVAVKAIWSVSSMECLISVCAPGGGDDVKAVRGVLDNVKKPPKHQIRKTLSNGVTERMGLFAEVDLLVLPFLPSRSDHFDLTVLQAISSCLPVLVTQESGIGRALRKMSHGDSRLLDCDDPGT